VQYQVPAQCTLCRRILCVTAVNKLMTLSCNKYRLSL
jgi:hypothetical protein